jgi:hypothetical protein
MSGVEHHKTAPPFMLEKLIEVGQHQLARDGDFSGTKGVIHVVCLLCLRCFLLPEL